MMETISLNIAQQQAYDLVQKAEVGDENAVDELCGSIYASTAGKWGTDEDMINTIMQNSSAKTKAKIVERYSEVTGSEIYKDIQNDYSGNSETEILNALGSAYKEINGEEYTGYNDGKLNNNQIAKSVQSGVLNTVKQQAPTAIGVTVAAAVGAKVAAATGITTAVAGTTLGAAAIAVTPFVLGSLAIVGGGYLIYKGVQKIGEAKEQLDNSTDDATSQNALATCTEGAIETAEGVASVTIGVKTVVDTAKKIVTNSATAKSTQETSVTTETASVSETMVTNTPGKFNGYSNASEPEVYRFNPNGTTEEILANNPGVSYEAESGKFYIQTSWGEKAYIDTSKEYLVAKYGEGDFNAIDGDIFKQTYVNSDSYHASGAHNYIDPTTMEYGQVTTAVKQAPVNFDVAEIGTIYTSLEGEATLQEGSVIMYDIEGNPYQNTIANLIKKNTLSRDGYQALLDGYPEYLDAHPELKEAITSVMQNLE